MTTTLSPPRAYWLVVDTDDPLSEQMRELNRQQLAIARQRAPESWDVIEDIVSRLAARMGISESQALAYCDIGIFLKQYERVAEVLDHGALSERHVVRIARDVVAVFDANQPAVEAEILDILTPSRPNQAVSGVRTIHSKIQTAVEKHQSEARPTDPDEVPGGEDSTDPTTRTYFSVDNRDLDCPGST